MDTMQQFNQQASTSTAYSQRGREAGGGEREGDGEMEKDEERDGERARGAA